MSLVVSILSFASCKGKSEVIKVYGADSTVIGDLNSIDSTKTEGAYLYEVRNEVIGIISSVFDCSTKDAEKKLKNNGYTVYTCFDKAVNGALNSTVREYNDIESISASAVDLEGNLVGIALVGSEDKNLPTAIPCSAFKPLSVYAPATEKGLINWSSSFKDSPFKKIKGEDSKMTDWPKNASGTYSNNQVLISEAIKKSLNTVAVKCLDEYGVNKSIDFLTSNFGINLTEERNISTVSGEEEVIGNIALGYLSKGVTTADMAGYYQIFANGGVYIEPKTVLKICDSDGSIIYEREYKEKKVISPFCADIMNRFLRTVTEKGGTGEKARCENIATAGKTGTDDKGNNNWFSGIIPQYSISVWHSRNKTNAAPEIFSCAVEKLSKEKELKTSFTNYENLQKRVYCKESGKLAGKKCTQIEMGYYFKNNVPSVCDAH